MGSELKLSAAYFQYHAYLEHKHLGNQELLLNLTLFFHESSRLLENLTDRQTGYSDAYE